MGAQHSPFAPIRIATPAVTARPAGKTLGRSVRSWGGVWAPDPSFLPPAWATPQEKLLWAILDDAVGCLRGTVTIADEPGAKDTAPQRQRVQQSLAQQAWAWILSDARYSFSFLDVCEALGLEPNSVRRGLRTYLESRGWLVGCS